MQRYMLIHGSWHGAWCWFKVAPRLRQFGEVVVPDLPGRAARPAWAPMVSLRGMVDALSWFLRADVATTIVVHSRYGVLATALAERYPERVRRVIYLASFLLPSGERVADHFAGDHDSYIRDFVSVDRLSVRDRLSPEAYVEGLYADCAAEDVQLARSLLCAEPSRPALARVRTGARFAGVAKAYIRLTQDRAVSPALQDRLLAATPVERVASLEASHSAYFSRPDQLVATIRHLDRP